jgi:hypothetical protein
VPIRSDRTLERAKAAHPGQNEAKTPERHGRGGSDKKSARPQPIDNVRVNHADVGARRRLAPTGSILRAKEEKSRWLLSSPLWRS